MAGSLKNLLLLTGMSVLGFRNQVNVPATIIVFNAAGQKVYDRSLVTGSTSYTQIEIGLGLKATPKNYFR